MNTLDTALTMSSGSGTMKNEDLASASTFATTSLEDSVGGDGDFFDKFLRDNADDMNSESLANVNNSSFRASSMLGGGAGGAGSGDVDTDAFLTLGNLSMNGSMNGSISMMMDFMSSANNLGEDGNNSNNNNNNSISKFHSNHSSSTPPLHNSAGIADDGLHTDNNSLSLQAMSHHSNNSSSADKSDSRMLSGSFNRPAPGAGMGPAPSNSNSLQFGLPYPGVNASANGAINSDVAMGQQQRNVPSNRNMNSGATNKAVSGMKQSASFHPVDDATTDIAFGNAAVPNNGNHQFSNNRIKTKGNSTFASVFPTNASPSLSTLFQGNNALQKSRKAAMQGNNNNSNTNNNNNSSSIFDASTLDEIPMLASPSETSLGIGGPMGMQLGSSGQNMQASSLSSTAGDASMSPFELYKEKKLKQQQQNSTQPTNNASRPNNPGTHSSVFHNMNASQLKSTMSDGMLARVLKAKYNTSGGSGNGGMGNANFSFSNNKNARGMMAPGFNRVSGLPRNAISSAVLSGPSRGPIAASISRSKLRHAANTSSGYINAGSRSRLAAIEISGPDESGQKNATWGSSTKRSSSALFAKLLSSKGMKKDPSKLVSTKSTSSISKLLASRRHSSRNLLSSGAAGSMAASGSSSTSINNFLRNSKKLTKTQSLLRQSSQKSLSKRQSFQNLTDSSAPGKVDLSFLLPPSHTKPQFPDAQQGQNQQQQREQQQQMQRGSGQSGGMPPLLSPGSILHADNGVAARRSGAFPMAGVSGSAVVNKSSQGMRNNGGAASGDAISTDSSLLHQSCRLYPTTAAVVESAIRIDPNAVRRAVPITTTDANGRQSGGDVYGYPINIAIKHNATAEVVQMLAQADPNVLVQKDGQEGSSSLAIAIQTKCDPSILQVLYQTNPKCVEVPDRRANTPLHTAVSSGAAVSIVKQLYKLYPKALEMRNFNSMTPLDLAQQSTRCSEDVMNFLQSSAFSPLENRAYHFDSAKEPTKAKHFGMGGVGNAMPTGLMSMAGVPGTLEEGLDDIMEANIQ